MELVNVMQRGRTGSRVDLDLRLRASGPLSLLDLLILQLSTKPKNLPLMMLRFRRR
jgi:hypothetical protein